MTNTSDSEKKCLEAQNKSNIEINSNLNIRSNQHQSVPNDSIDPKHPDKMINIKDTVMENTTGDISNVEITSNETTNKEKKINYGFFFILIDSFIKSIVDKENAPKEKNVPTEHSGMLAHQDLMDISTKYFIENSKVLNFEIPEKETLYLGRLCGAILRDVSHLRGSVNGVLNERDNFNRFLNEKSNSKTKTKIKVKSDNANFTNFNNTESNLSNCYDADNIKSETNQSDINTKIPTNVTSNLFVKPLPSHIVGISVLEFFSGIGYVRTRFHKYRKNVWIDTCIDYFS